MIAQVSQSAGIWKKLTLLLAALQNLFVIHQILYFTRYLPFWRKWYHAMVQSLVSLMHYIKKWSIDTEGACSLFYIEEVVALFTNTVSQQFLVTRLFPVCQPFKSLMISTEIFHVKDLRKIHFHFPVITVTSEWFNSLWITRHLLF